MPELNQNFIKGRMNKDLDERLVPNGEYRDALNIEVATSEGSDVGSVQTLMGNTLRGDTLSGFCVASIADEKTNKIYYLVSGENKDAVIEYDSESLTEKPVLVDIYNFDIVVDTPGHGDYDHIHVELLGNAVNIRPGMTVTGTLTHPLTGISTTYGPANGLVVSKVEDYAGGLNVYLEDISNANAAPITNIPSSQGDVLTFTAERVLNFDQGEFITGINIIDDFLFWTDNKYEPKQISISRCLEGTDSINHHTKVAVKNPINHTFFINYNTSGTYGGMTNVAFIKEEHITVVKRSPLVPPTLEMSNTRANRVHGIYAQVNTNFAGFDVNNNVVNDSIGTTYNITFDSPVSYMEGDTIMGTNDPDMQFEDSFPTHSVRLQISGPPTNNSQTYVVTLTSITTSNLPETDNLWFFLLDQEKSMFTSKFPRFAYRYKYTDGEYSSFSPFSEPAFLPATFDYHPKKGYNLGMENSLRFLKLKDFVVERELLPKGVVAIDILYKESNSPNIYTVKTILHNDDEWNKVTTGGLMKGTTIIESELIYATLPSNQLLRPWDNVPRKALAQEVTGNRIVYGNYLQNYDLKDFFGKEIKVDITTTLKSVDATLKEPEKSIKTLRTYQFGVVYRDKYGRETPVLASGETDDQDITVGTLNVPKLFADQYNSLEAQINSNYPSWAHSFKFFIKETSNEYYNIAMDRWYNAEDGNIWISFPSKERNKIDIDTVLILKKQHDNNVFVDDTSKYRVLSIDNEAPQFVKRKRSSFGSVPMTWNVFADQDTFKNSGLIESLGKSDCVMRVTNTGNQSNWYDVGGISLSTTGGYYIVSINGMFGPDMAFTDPNFDGTVISGLELEIAQNTYENRPEFDGRFFVKIYKDVALENNIVKVGQVIPQFSIKQTKHHYYLNNQKGRDDDWWSLAWERGDFFIDGEKRRLVNYNTGASGFLTVSEANNGGFTINSAYWSGKGNYPFYPDDGFGINSSTHGGIGQSRPNTTNYTNGGKIPHTHCLELSVSGMKEHHHYDEPGAYELSGSELDYQVSFWDAISSVGTMFRWRNDPDGVIYQITHSEDSGEGGGGDDDGTNGHGILNFSASSYSGKKKENDNKTRRLYLTFITSESGWRKDSQLQLQLPNNTTNDNPDKYIADPNLVNQQPHWRGGNTPPCEFDPTLNYSGWTTSNSNTYPAIAASIGHSDPIKGSSQSALGPHDAEITTSILNEFTNTIEIVDIYYDDFESRQSENPAIWETEPKEDVGLDIYYEASQAYPIQLNSITNEMYAPYGSVVQNEGPPTGIAANTFTTKPTISSWSDNVVSLTGYITTETPQMILSMGDIISFTRPDGSITRARVAVTPAVGSNKVVLSRFVNNMKMTLPWFNCYSFGNGVESNRIRDDFNQVTIDKGAKASTTVAGQYKEERRGSGLIYSGIYNSNSGINNLNQFIMAEPITKDLNPRFGSIQKLHSRDTDIVTCCEDKILKILANKDAVFNADGNVNLTATNRVLGQVIPYTGEYGISKNPESFAFQAYRSYFSDKARGVVLRLSKDGLTAISSHGLKDWFSDNLRDAFDILGSYDDKKEIYNITLNCTTNYRASSSGTTTNSGSTGTNTSTSTNTSNVTIFSTTGVATVGNQLGNWMRYGGLTDTWAKVIETGGWNSGVANPGGVPPGTVGSTQPHGRGWAGIRATTSPTLPAGIEHGESSPVSPINQNLTNPITLFFDKLTTGLGTTAPSYDTTSNWNDLISALNTHGAGNVYLYQNFYHPTQTQTILTPTGYISGSSVQHQAETCYAIQSIELDGASGTYKVIVDWLVGYSSNQDSNIFVWSLDSPWVITNGGDNGDNGDDNGDNGNGDNGDGSGSTTEGKKDYTVSFSDKVNGWVSFKSWIKENGLSMNNRFYTFSGGNLWEHHVNNSRNNFYNAAYPQISTIDVLLNASPNAIKSIEFLKYSGSQGAITSNISTANWDGEYYNNWDKLGWFASSVETDLQSGKRLEFKEKEGKWFAAMQGEKTYFNSALDTNIDMSEFSFQGIGTVDAVLEDDGGGSTGGTGCDAQVLGPVIGYGNDIDDATGYFINAGAINFSPSTWLTNPATDLPHTYTLFDSNGVEFFPVPTHQPNHGGPPGGAAPWTRFRNLPASGTYTWTVTSASGCTETGTIDLVLDTWINGCTDPTAQNYNPNANVDDGSCIYSPPNRVTLTIEDDPSDH